MNTVLSQRIEQLRPMLPGLEADLDSLLRNTGESAGTIRASDTQLCAEIQAWLQAERMAETPQFIVVMGCLSMAEFMAVTGRLKKQDHLLMLEADSSAVLRFIQLNLVERWLRDQRIGLAVGHRKETVKQQFFSLYHPKRDPEIVFLDTGRSRPDDHAFYMETLREIREEIRLDVFNAGTLVCRGPLWQFNTLINLPLLATHPGIRALEGLFGGRPALVVGAGPSLNEALPLIKQQADRFVIISTGTALRPLRECGIRPDLVVAVDGSHLIRPQFETECSDLFFSCSSLVYSDITNKFRGIFSGGLEASPLDHWIDERIAPRGMMYAGGTVTCSAMYLAALMGCPTVCTVGLDLCFLDDGTTHAGGTMYDGHRNDPRSLIQVPGNYRAAVSTTQQFQCYIDLIRDFVARTPQSTFVNLNSDGARIPGMTLAPIGALAEFAGETFDAYAVIENAHQAFRPVGLDALRAELREVRNQLDTIQGRSREGAELCNRIVMHLKAPQADTLEQIRPCVDQLSELEDELEAAKTSNIFTRMSLWPAFYEFSAHQNDHEESTVESQSETFHRFRKLYEQVAGASKWTRDALDQVLGRWAKEESVTDEAAQTGLRKVNR
ncbi:MAG: DUF115 domain-containing protein [Kiritimatiellae bacterium]|nr:DUF115 domain-containing protein [Kiritimatiellia bacterium]